MSIFHLDRHSKNEIGDSTLSDRIRRARKPQQRHNYWISVIMLAGVAILSNLIFVPGSRNKEVALPPPHVSPPVYKLLAIKKVQVNKIKALTVLAQSHHSNKDSLKGVMDWILYSVITDYNQRKREQIRAVWVYIYQDSVERLAQWKAMAVWVDSTLPSALKPAAARIGGDRIKIGAVEYDFTNSLESLHIDFHLWIKNESGLCLKLSI
ncbi:MAG: hypothetical protein ACUVUD_05165 [bacterium]